MERSSMNGAKYDGNESQKDISDIPSDVHDFCANEKFTQPLFDINVSRPKEMQFTESTRVLLGKLTITNQTPALENEEAKNPSDVKEMERLKRENAQYKEKQAKQDQEKILIEKKLEKFKNMVDDLTSRKPTQIVYIATCERYARQNMFKVGGVEKLDQLKGRLKAYNVGRTTDDFFYYCFWVKCSNYRRLEQRIADVVGQHRVREHAEMYNLHYSSLKEVVEYLSERFNEEEKTYQEKFDFLIQETLEREPEVPGILVVNGAEFRQMNQSCATKYTGTKKQHDFDTMEESEQRSLVANELVEYLNSGGTISDDSILMRKDFENHLSQKNIIFRSRKLWEVLKDEANNNSNIKGAKW